MIRASKNKNRFKREMHPHASKIIIGGIIIILFLVIFKFFYLSGTAIVQRQLSPSEQAIVAREKIFSEINEILVKYGIRPEWISRTAEKRKIRVPASLPVIQICQDIALAAKEQQAQILESYEDLRSETVFLEIGFQEQSLVNLEFIRDKSLTPVVGNIALIIDDFGHSFSGTAEAFLKLDIPLTVAIIPGLRHSAKIAEEAVINQKDILIHLPMEPRDEKVVDNGFTILVSQTEAEIRQRVQAAIQTLPAASGVNNHQGSKAMTDARVVQTVLDEIKRNKLFFIDSKTTPHSLGEKIAGELKIPAAARDVFLDDDEDPEQIKIQLYKLARKSRAQGTAIGIGHVKPNTLAVLQAEILPLKLLGYQFVLLDSKFKRKKN